MRIQSLLTAVCDNKQSWILYAVISLLALNGCQSAPIEPDGGTSSQGVVDNSSVDSFWEQAPNTDPRLRRIAPTSAGAIGRLRTRGPQVRSNRRVVRGPREMRNGVHLTTGENSWARVDFYQSGQGCRVDIVDFRYGRGYGETGGCEHRVVSVNAENHAPQGDTAYHVEVTSGRTITTVFRGNVNVRSRENLGVVEVPAGYEVVVENGLVGMPRRLAPMQLRERSAWRVDFDQTDFPRTEPNLARVPDVVGRDLDWALRILARTDLRTETSGSGSRVVDQSPSGGRQVPPGTSVRLYLDGDGAARYVLVPSVVDMPASDAELHLSRVGLTSRLVGSGRRVISQKPKSGVRVPRGSIVHLQLRPNREQAPIDDVIGIIEPLWPRRPEVGENPERPTGPADPPRQRPPRSEIKGAREQSSPPSVPPQRRPIESLL